MTCIGCKNINLGNFPFKISFDEHEKRKFVLLETGNQCVDNEGISIEEFEIKHCPFCGKKIYFDN